MYYSIAIDGPGSAGKSTIAKQLARKLNFIYVDTGAMYRAAAIYFIRKNIASTAEDKICSLLDEITIELKQENESQQVYLNKENVTNLLRTEQVGEFSSVISTYQKVREKLVSLQQEMGKKSSIIMDGRDIGTVVLPNANLKIFLTATIEVRAKRRYLELKEKGIVKTEEEVLKDLMIRDDRDINRKHSPLKQAADAILLDTTNLTIEEVCDEILKLWEEKQK